MLKKELIQPLMSSLAADKVLMLGAGGTGTTLCADGFLLETISWDQFRSFCRRVIDFASRIDNGCSSIYHHSTYLVADYTYRKVAVRCDHITACRGEIAYIAGTIVAIRACCRHGPFCDSIGWAAAIQRDPLDDKSQY